MLVSQEKYKKTLIQGVPFDIFQKLKAVSKIMFVNPKCDSMSSHFHLFPYICDTNFATISYYYRISNPTLCTAFTIGRLS